MPGAFDTLTQAINAVNTSINSALGVDGSTTIPANTMMVGAIDKNSAVQTLNMGYKGGIRVEGTDTSQLAAYTGHFSSPSANFALSVQTAVIDPHIRSNTGRLFVWVNNKSTGTGVKLNLGCTDILSVALPDIWEVTKWCPAGEHHAYWCLNPGGTGITYQVVTTNASSEAFDVEVKIYSV